MGLDDEILRMAREADCLHVNLVGDRAKALERLKRFAALAIEDFLNRSGQYLTNDASREAAIAEAVASEREACAQVLDAMADEAEADMEPNGMIDYFRAKAAEIRARGSE